MKAMFLGAVMLLSASAFAQQSASEVCHAISTYSSSSAATCAGIISRAQFDQSSLKVAFALAKGGSPSNALKVMEISGNRYLDDEVGEVCKQIMTYSNSNAVSCVEASLDQAFDPAVATIAMSIAKSGSSSNAVLALQTGKNANVNPAAALVCVELSRFSSSRAVECISAILNKDYFNGAEGICLNLAKSGSSSSAVACLQNSGVETYRRPGRRNRGNGGRIEVPAQRNVVISVEQLKELSRKIRQSRGLYERGQYQKLGDALIDLNRTMEEVEAQTQVIR